jgi:hypothetical protein
VIIGGEQVGVRKRDGALYVKTPLRYAPPVWCEQHQFFAGVVAHKRNLGLIVQFVNGVFVAMAFETSSDTLQGALDEHGHMVIGQKFKSLRAAKVACEKYAKVWRKKHTMKKCDCREIAL